MDEADIERLTELLNDRTMALMARESDLADRKEEIEAQHEEITAAVEEVQLKNKELEATLNQLKERNQELDEILYRFSHDLRSPVSSILGVLSILKFESIPDKIITYLDHIQSKSLQMKDLLDSVSALAKVVNKKLDPTNFNFPSLVDTCVKDCALHPNYDKISFEIEHLGNGQVFTDKNLLGILIKSLLLNSLSYRDPLLSGKIKIKSNHEFGILNIEIADDGEGISDQIKNHIYNMFYRGSERSTGSGLGLYIVKKIAEQLNGSIHFSNVHDLTVFYVAVRLENSLFENSVL